MRSRTRNLPALEERKANELALWSALAHLPAHHVAAIAHVDLSVRGHRTLECVATGKDEDFKSYLLSASLFIFLKSPDPLPFRICSSIWAKRTLIR
jgi:hypothetical protein